MTNIDDDTLLSNVERVMAGEEPEPRVETIAEFKNKNVELPPAAPAANLVKYEPPTKLSPLQMIAKNTTQLTWREAEKQAKGIEEKMKGGASLVQAIQDYSWGWQTFRDDEPPRPEGEAK